MVKGRAIKSNKEKKTVVSNKKKERDQFKKEMDMVLLKKRIGEIIKNISDEKRLIEDYNDKYKKNIEIMNEKYTDNSLYQTMFQIYMKNEYTLICISFINKIIINSKNNNLEQYEGKYNFNKIFTDITKELLLSQYELILLSLYLEYINLSLYFHIFGFEESVLYLSYFIKKLTSDNNEIYPILYHLNKKYENFETNYEKWYKLNENKFNEKIYFNYKEINKRFKEYNTPFNEYCGENFIDYNYIVDRILTMSLPYADIRKGNKNENQNEKDNNNIKENSDIDTNKLIANDNNVLNNISKKIIEDPKDQNLLKPEFIFNNNNKGNINNINEPQNNANFNINNNKNNSRIFQNITPNNLLHSLCNNNKLRQNQINNKILVSNINNFNTNNKETNNQYLLNKTINSNNLVLNPIPTPSQTSLLFQQKPPFIDIFNKSHIFDEENETLKQILKNSNDNAFMRSSQSFDSSKYPFGIFLSNNNLGNNSNNINNNVNNKINNNNINNNDNNKKIYKSNDIPFKPLNIICNKNFYRNIINNPNIIYNNNYGNNIPNNNPSNINEK